MVSAPKGSQIVPNRQKSPKTARCYLCKKRAENRKKTSFSVFYKTALASAANIAKYGSKCRILFVYNIRWKHIDSFDLSDPGAGKFDIFCTHLTFLHKTRLESAIYWTKHGFSRFFGLSRLHKSHDNMHNWSQTMFFLCVFLQRYRTVRNRFSFSRSYQHR